MVVKEDEEDDALAKLIKRAEALRESLIDATAKTAASCRLKLPNVELETLLSEDKERGASPTLDHLLDTLLVGEPLKEADDLDDDFPELPGGQEPLDVSDDAEDALLQELFFSSKDARIDQALHCASRPLNAPPKTSDAPITPAATGVSQNGGLQLVVTIDKLVLSEPTVKDLTKPKQSVLGRLGNASSMLPNCTCLLTIFFPAVFDVAGAKLCPEQRISISPAKMEKRAMDFDYKSQLFWKLQAGKPREDWWVHPVKTTVYLRWHCGEAVECYGYMSLKTAVTSGPSGFFTNLVLVGGKATGGDHFLKDEMLQNNHPVPKNTERTKKKSNERNVDTEGKPLATLDIGLTLVGGMEYTSCTKPEQEVERVPSGDSLPGPWAYMNLQNIVDFVANRSQPLQYQRMVLVVRSGSTIIFRTIDTGKRERYLDAVLQALSDNEGPIFLEIWGSWRAYEGLDEGLEDLIGMVKVPYSLETWKQRKNKQGTVKFSGKYALWHPNRKSVSGGVAVSIVLGQRYPILRLQAENHAAALIQHFARKFLRRRKDKDDMNMEDATSWHIFEVNVQKLTGLPDDPQHFNDKVFIKYIFPGEKEPLYTQETDWLKTIIFEASACHRISLSHNTTMGSYIKKIDRKGLRFEIWLSFKAGPDQVNEQHLGTSILSQESLLRLLDLHEQAKQKATRLFHLPVDINSNCLNVVTSENLKLFVEAGYQSIQFSEQLLKGTILADYSHQQAPGPVEATFDIKINKARGLQDALDAMPSWQGSVNPYVRFSLFPFNQNLESLYPPSLTHFKENTVAPFYGWSASLVVTMTVDVVNELKKSRMNFEIWHHSKGKKNTSLTSCKSLESDVWLATASAPCSALLSTKAGVSGWLQLLSRRGDTVGEVEVEAKFSSWKRLK